ncbi:YcxB family protein [Lacticaseibacillus kribbianus]|uniref:YcxB family protein n=1 Tax=Lacticaseibacillus kribbianus TaxID=2926292 RepID=UPI001CD2FF17|nr:YcxB family protein [Lacticaseibacillus kribbianus]
MELHNVSIQLADYTEYNLYMIRHSHNWLVQVANYAGPVLGVLLLAFAGLFAWQGRLAEAALYLVLAVLLLLVTLHVALRWQARREFRATKNAAMFESRDLVIDDTGITVTSAHATSHADWASFLSVGETDRVFVLLVAKRMAQLLPKADLDAAQLTELRALFTAHVADVKLMNEGVA